MTDEEKLTEIFKHLDNITNYIQKLERDIKDLESMCRAAGYSDEQIKYRTPYIEIMGD